VDAQHRVVHIVRWHGCQEGLLEADALLIKRLQVSGGIGRLRQGEAYQVMSVTK
jgi:hypothetical protein